MLGIGLTPDSERTRLQLDGLSLAGRRNQFAIHANAGAGGDFRDRFFGHNACIQHHLKIRRRGSVVELDEMHVLAVAACFDPAARSHSFARGAFEQAPRIAIGLNHCCSRRSNTSEALSMGLAYSGRSFSSSTSGV